MEPTATPKENCELAFIALTYFPKDFEQTFGEWGQIDLLDGTWIEDQLQGWPDIPDWGDTPDEHKLKIGDAVIGFQACYIGEGIAPACEMAFLFDELGFDMFKKTDLEALRTIGDKRRQHYLDFDRVTADINYQENEYPISVCFMTAWRIAHTGSYEQGSLDCEVTLLGYVPLTNMPIKFIVPESMK